MICLFLLLSTYLLLVTTICCCCSLAKWNEKKIPFILTNSLLYCDLKGDLGRSKNKKTAAMAMAGKVGFWNRSGIHGWRFLLLQNDIC